MLVNRSKGIDLTNKIIIIIVNYSGNYVAKNQFYVAMFRKKYEFGSIENWS